MFLKERQEAIYNLLRSEGRVTVTDLAARFDVSEDCIRKDLKQLNREGKCKRVYGGAISTADLPERNVYRRIHTRTEEKRIIAERAFEEIYDGETIFLDVSSTNLYLAELLGAGEKQCIVISNMIDVLQTLAKNPRLTVLGTGGNVNLELNGFVGATTVNFLESLYFDKVFIGTLGVRMEDGAVTTFDVDDGLVKSTVIARAAKKYLVADAHKFGVMGNYRFADLAEFDGIISEATDPELLKQIGDLGGKLLREEESAL